MTQIVLIWYWSVARYDATQYLLYLLERLLYSVSVNCRAIICKQIIRSSQNFWRRSLSCCMWKKKTDFSWLNITLQALTWVALMHDGPRQPKNLVGSSTKYTITLRRRSRQRRRLYASMLSVVCLSVAKMRTQNAIFLKTKPSRAMVSIDDQWKVICMGFPDSGVPRNYV